MPAIMFRRLLASIGLAAITALVASLPVSGQSAAAPPLVITAFNGGPAPANWTPPKTPWGEPHLQGVWSSDDATFPISRPQPGQGRGGRAGTPPAASTASPQGLYLSDEE